jgi:hypothetical protein
MGPSKTREVHDIRPQPLGAAHEGDAAILHIVKLGKQVRSNPAGLPLQGQGGAAELGHQAGGRSVQHLNGRHLGVGTRLDVEAADDGGTGDWIDRRRSRSCWSAMQGGLPVWRHPHERR